MNYFQEFNMIFSKLSVCGGHVDRMWRHLACSVNYEKFA